MYPILRALAWSLVAFPIMLLAFAVGCAMPFRAHDGSISFTVHPSFGSLAPLVHAAGAKWSGITVEPVRFDDEDDPWPWIILRADPPPGYTGWYDARRRVIFVSSYVEDWLVYNIVLHEIGHALGLQHGASGVMCGADRSTDCPTPGATEFSAEDRAECHRVRRCSPLP